MSENGQRYTLPNSPFQFSYMSGWVKQNILQITQWINRTSYLIGLTDLDTEGNFVWDSGSELSADMASHWEPGQPNNWKNKDHCVRVHKGNMMRDVTCTYKYTFVCQKRQIGK